MTHTTPHAWLIHCMHVLLILWKDVPRCVAPFKTHEETLVAVCRWKRLEDERVAQEEERKLQAENDAAAGLLEGAAHAQTLSYLEALAQRNQIFKMSEAFHMLSKELSDMMLNPVSRDTGPTSMVNIARYSSSCTINALHMLNSDVHLQDIQWGLDAVHEDAYQWEVNFSRSDFSPDSPLTQVRTPCSSMVLGSLAISLAALCQSDLLQYPRLVILLPMTSILQSCCILADHCAYAFALRAV